MLPERDRGTFALVIIVAIAATIIGIRNLYWAVDTAGLIRPPSNSHEHFR
jgi:hypothetical protein